MGRTSRRYQRRTASARERLPAGHAPGRLDHAVARPGIGRAHRHQRHRPELPEYRGPDRPHDRGRPGPGDRVDHRLDHRCPRPARAGRLHPAGTRPEGPAPGHRQREGRARAARDRPHLRAAGQGVAHHRGQLLRRGAPAAAGVPAEARGHRARPAGPAARRS